MLLFESPIVTEHQKNVGKTCLVKKLQGMDLKKNEISTDGIDFHYLEQGAIKLQIWDFAGQEIFYSTHSFYLSDSAIYLIVWDVNDADSLARAEYWIASLLAFFQSTSHSKYQRRKSKLIVIGTHVADQLSIEKYQFDLKYLKRGVKYSASEIDDDFAIDCFSKPQSIIPLRASLFDHAKNLTDHIPTIYLSIDHTLNEIKQAKELPVCKLSELITPSHPLSILSRALSFFHHYGKIILPPNTRTSLSKFSRSNQTQDNMMMMMMMIEEENDFQIILNCKWLNEAMRTLITHKHQMVASDAIISNAMLKEIWKEPAFPSSIHPYLISVLSHFDIIYSFSQSHSSSINKFNPKINSNNITNNKKNEDLEKQMYFIAYLLNHKKPEEVLALERRCFYGFTADGEIQNGSDRLDLVIERIFPIRLIPSGLMARIQSRLLHHLNDSLIFLFKWKDGCFAQHRSLPSISLLIEFVFISSYNQPTNHKLIMITNDTKYEQYIRLVMRRDEKNNAESLKILRSVMKLIESICTEWFFILEIDQIQCIDLQTTPFVHHSFLNLIDLFSKNKLISISDNLSSANVPHQQSIRSVLIKLGSLIPDVMIDDKQLKIDESQLQILNKLGKGSFGAVYKAILSSNTFNNIDHNNQMDSLPNQQIAIKVLQTKKNTENNNNNNNHIKRDEGKQKIKMMEEITIMANLRPSPYIVRLIGFGSLQSSSNQFKIDRTNNVDDEGLLFAAMEFVEGGSLFEYVHDPLHIINIATKFRNLTRNLQAISTLNHINPTNPELESKLQKKYDKVLSKISNRNYHHDVCPVWNDVIDVSKKFLSNPSPELSDQFDKLILELINYERIPSEIRPFPFHVVLRIAIQLAKAVDHLHSSSPPIIHRDLKLDNCFISFSVNHQPVTNSNNQDDEIDEFTHSDHSPDDCSKWDDYLNDVYVNDCNNNNDKMDLIFASKYNDEIYQKFHLKLGDFGLSAMLLQGEFQGEIKGGMFYRAPEVLNHNAYSLSSDIYSVGLMMWELLHRGSAATVEKFASYFPSSNDSSSEFVLEQIKCNAVRPIFNYQLIHQSEQAFYKEFELIIQSAWHQNPFSRPTSSQLLNSLRTLKTKYNHQFINQAQRIEIDQNINKSNNLINPDLTNTTKMISKSGEVTVEKMAIMSGCIARNSKQHPSFEFSKMYFSTKHAQLMFFRIADDHFVHLPLYRLRYPVDPQSGEDLISPLSQTFINKILCNINDHDQLVTHLVTSSKADQLKPDQIHILQFTHQVSKTSHLNDTFEVFQKNDTYRSIGIFKFSIKENKKELFFEGNRQLGRLESYYKSPTIRIPLENKYQDPAFLLAIDINEPGNVFFHLRSEKNKSEIQHRMRLINEKLNLLVERKTR